MDSIFYKVNGLKIYAFSSKEKLVAFAIDKKKALIAINAHKILLADDGFRELVNNNIGYCDGIGSRMALKRMGSDSAIKIPGCELWLDIVSKLYNKKNFVIIGSSDNVINRTVSLLKRSYNKINILKFRNGFFNSNHEYEKSIKDIISLKPDVVFVAMGSPRQESLIARLMEKHSAIYMGLGGSLDVYCGEVKRVPQILQDIHLEWLYRWFMEPIKRTKKNLLLFKFIFYLKTGKFD
jgi:UDP-N-acetyl-D-mannosaminouronate:lipid I N-acetyl-D-mannosaminouronosyltransferase